MSRTARDLAHEQITIDAARFGRFPQLAINKRLRMSTSPLAFLRGAAPLFYELLKERSELAAGPDGTGWIVGDLHVENFGAFRPDVPLLDEQQEAVGERAIFDVNDFDDATIAPQRFDVLRLTTSLLITLRNLGVEGAQRIELGRVLLAAHADALLGGGQSFEEPPCIRALLDTVRRRTRVQLLDKRTEEHKGTRRFVRGPRYVDLDPRIASGVPAAFASYVAALPEADRPRPGVFEIIDSAFRIAGTGSLGVLRVAILTIGKGGRDGGFVFDMKEQGDPSSSVLVAPPADPPAERVKNAILACLALQPRMVGTAQLAGLSCLVRRLAPQEDRLDWRRVGKDELQPMIARLGMLVGRLHRRGATAPASSAWTVAERRELLHNAVELCALHEAVYLAYCAEVLKPESLTSS